MKRIRLIDYGSGNIGSVLLAFSKIGIILKVTDDASDIRNADLVIVPGVGSAGGAMNSLENSSAGDALIDRHKEKKPLLGICLGAQVFMNKLHEGQCKGFGFIDGDVPKFPESINFNTGWSRINWDELKSCGLNRGLYPSSTFYFNHGYYMNLKGKHKTVSIDSENLNEVPAIYCEGPVCGIQFHPEKSQESGLKLLRNVMEDYYGF